MKLTQKKVDKLFLKAIEDGDLPALKYLLNESPLKANLHLTNEVEDPEYCLVVATQYNQLEIFKYLLEETALKKYTKVSGIQAYIKNNFYDSLNIMYEYAGQNGNLEFIQYITSKLQLEDKFQLFANAALDSHIDIMDYMLKNELSKNDKVSLGNIKNQALEYALINNRKEAVKYLLEYYKTTPYKKDFEGSGFKVYALSKLVSRIKKDSTDFELFDEFFNDKEVIENQHLLKKELFKEIASRKNFNLYTKNIEKIKDKELKKEIILKTHCYAIEDYGTLKDYPLYTYILEKYKSYFDKSEKEGIFYSLIYSNERQRFHDLMKYDFLKKGVDPNKILQETFDKVRVEDAFEYAKLLLGSDFRSKIKIHYNDNVYFKLMNQELESKEIIELLTFIFQKYPETKVEKIEDIFKNKEEVTDFFIKYKLNTKLQNDLPLKNNKIKAIKI